MLLYFMAIWSTLRPFGIHCGHLVYFVVIWHILWLFGIFCGYLVYFSSFGMLYQEKSGNTAEHETEKAEVCQIALANLTNMAMNDLFLLLVGHEIESRKDI
jgi:hypothetical protein